MRVNKAEKLYFKRHCRMKKIVLIGSGNVATHLGKALILSDVQVLQVWSRTIENAVLLANELQCEAINSFEQLTPDADAYLFSVNDDALLDLLKAFPFQDKRLLHTAGSVAMEVIAPYASNYGVLYPLQTFSKQKAVDFKTIPLFIEAANAKTLDFLKSIAKCLSDKVIEATSEQRKFLHISAVFACNFTNYLYTVAEDILTKNQLSFDLIRPLIAETAEKALHYSPREVQTGPAARKDKAIIQSHIDLLENTPDWQELYATLSEKIDKNVIR